MRILGGKVKARRGEWVAHPATQKVWETASPGGGRNSTEGAAIGLEQEEDGLLRLLLWGLEGTAPGGGPPRLRGSPFQSRRSRSEKATTPFLCASSRCLGAPFGHRGGGFSLTIDSVCRQEQFDNSAAGRAARAQMAAIKKQSDSASGGEPVLRVRLNPCRLRNGTADKGFSIAAPLFLFLQRFTTELFIVLVVVAVADGLTLGVADSSTVRMHVRNLWLRNPTSTMETGFLCSCLCFHLVHRTPLGRMV